MQYDLSKVSIGNAAAIGKIRLLPSNTTPHHLPMLHCIVLKDAQGCYSAVCIQLRLTGYGNTIQSSMEHLKESILDFVKGTFDKAPAVEDAYGSLYSLMEIDPWAEEWWNAYRKLQMKLALQGIKTDFYEKLEEEINSLKKKIIDLESAQKIYSFKKEQKLIAEIIDLHEVA